MYKRVALTILGFFCLASAQVHAGGAKAPHNYQAPYLDGRFQCVFKNAVHFGASLTYELMASFPLIVLEPSFKASTGNGFGESPAKVLTSYYAKGKVLSNHSAKYGRPTGSEQIETILNDELGVLDKTSVVIGIDAFYWDASWKWCGYTEPRVSQLIHSMAKRKIPLILGTVPEENPANVTWNRLGRIRDYVWTPPDKDCLTSINNTIGSQCLIENGCYVLDLHSIVHELNAGRTMTLNNGSSYYNNDFRPDGVHISPHGTQYIVEEILRLLAQTPNICESK